MFIQQSQRDTDNQIAKIYGMHNYIKNLAQQATTDIVEKQFYI